MTTMKVFTHEVHFISSELVKSVSCHIFILDHYILPAQQDGGIFIIIVVVVVVTATAVFTLCF